ncbi:GIY-YIG nuclease family protein [Qipengyuania sp. SM2507]
MDRERQGGWVYIMANRYRGALYVGVTSDLARRVSQHRDGTGSDYCATRGLNRLVWAERGDDIAACIAHEKRVKRWRREWKFALIEQANPDWQDLFAPVI